MMLTIDFQKYSLQEYACKFGNLKREQTSQIEFFEYFGKEIEIIEEKSVEIWIFVWNRRWISKKADILKISERFSRNNLKTLKILPEKLEILSFDWNQTIFKMTFLSEFWNFR